MSAVLKSSFCCWGFQPGHLLKTHVVCHTTCFHTNSSGKRGKEERKEERKVTGCGGHMETHWMLLVVGGVKWPGRNSGCCRCITCAFLPPSFVDRETRGVFVCALSDCVLLPDLLSQTSRFSCCCSPWVYILGKDPQGTFRFTTCSSRWTATGERHSELSSHTSIQKKLQWQLNLTLLRGIYDKMLPRQLWAFTTAAISPCEFNNL